VSATDHAETASALAQLARILAIRGTRKARLDKLWRLHDKALLAALGVD